MGQNSSNSQKLNFPLKNIPDVYSKLQQYQDLFVAKSQPEDSQIQRKYQQRQIEDITQHNKAQYRQLKLHVTLLNDFELKCYLNHMIYRNQPEFSSIIRIPYGSIQSHSESSYHKLNLFVENIKVHLNQINSINFYDMTQILYFSLLGFKYLYNYFGLFKVESNMIGFTQNAQVKVWIHKKPTKHKYIPSQSDINLKRFKEEQSYMVDDLACIFWNKVDKASVPYDFAFMRNTNLKKSRLSHSRVSTNTQQYNYSRCFNQHQFNDFSDASFDKSLEYIQKYFNFQDENKQFSVYKKNLIMKNQIGSIKFLLKCGRQINESSSYNMKSDHFIKSLDKIVKVHYKTNQSLNSQKPKVTFNLGLNQNTQLPTHGNYQSKVSFNYQRPDQHNKLFLSQVQDKININSTHYRKQYDTQSLIQELHSQRFGDNQSNQNQIRKKQHFIFQLDPTKH